jgi:hypothetical protein
MHNMTLHTSKYIHLGVSEGLLADVNEWIHSSAWYRDRGIPYRRYIYIIPNLYIIPHNIITSYTTHHTIYIYLHIYIIPNLYIIPHNLITSYTTLPQGVPAARPTGQREKLFHYGAGGAAGVRHMLICAYVMCVCAYIMCLYYMYSVNPLYKHLYPPTYTGTTYAS